VVAGTPRRKTLPSMMGVKDYRTIHGQTRLVLMKVKNKKMILGPARCLLLWVLMTGMVAGTQQQRALHLRKRLMIAGIGRGVMMTARKLTPGVLARQVGIRNLLGANRISLWGIRNLLGTTQGLVMMTMEIIEADLDVEIVAEGEEGTLGMVVDHHGMEAIETMNQVAVGLESHGTGGILMVAEEEGEVALGVVTVIKATTLGQEMVAAGALAGETVAGVVTGTGTPLVEMIRQERVMPTTPGARTDHLHLSWVSQAVMLTSLALGVLPVEQLVAEVLGERATRITGTHLEDLPKRSLHGAVGQELLPRKRTVVPRGAGAKEVALAVPGIKRQMVALAVPGIKRQMVHGTATRVLILAVVDGKAFAKINLRLIGADM